MIAALIEGLGRLSLAELTARFAAGRPLEPAEVGAGVYRGLSLGLPSPRLPLPWLTFEKVIGPDGAGINLQIDQREPLRYRRALRRGQVVERWPFVVTRGPGPSGPTVVLDYRGAGPIVGRLRDPLVGDELDGQAFVLGRSLIALGRRTLATPSFFALVRAAS